MSNLNETPRANRVTYSVFGKTNSGKSTTINSIVGSDLALVSDVPGTTTDPVYKSMELLPLGPVVFIDTAGWMTSPSWAGRVSKRRARSPTRPMWRWS
jgi:predicted GTPase